ncbi:MAG: DnaJ C-terminal domain-containing protein [Chthoniobacterales bacterium]
MSAPDHYATLGLDRHCTTAEIRAAYRRLVKRHHPDVNRAAADATASVQSLNTAHETLRDPARRAAYDRELVDEKPPSPARPEGRTRDIAQDVMLRVEEFLRGATLNIRVNDPANPRGAESYELEVPPDTAPGTKFRLARAEPFSRSFVVVRARVLPGSRFRVRGSDLRCDLRISATRAAGGGTEAIPGPSGRMVRVTIPAGVARGAVLKVPGEGLPKPRGGRGDLLVRVNYRVEVKVTRGATQRRSFRRLG